MFELKRLKQFVTGEEFGNYSVKYHKNERRDLVKEYRIKLESGEKVFTTKERLEYLKKLSGEIQEEIFKRPEQLFVEEVDSLLELLKIELIHYFKH